MNISPIVSSVTILSILLTLSNLSVARAATVVPTPMKLSITNVVTKTWNSAADAFGLWREQEGPAFGPAAVAYDNGRIFLLDTVKNRILEFDKRGKAQSTISLPFTEPTDLVVDPATSSLLVVAQRRGELCKINAGGSVVRLPSVDMKRLVFPAKFAYETNSSTLFAQDAAAPALLSPMLRAEVALTAEMQAISVPLVTTDIQGQNLMLILNGGTQTVTLDMGKNVACVEDVVTDAQGAIWALYTLEGDYRMRRLVRVDIAKSTAGVAVTDVWFAFDATRHMAAMENGVVLFAGDLNAGRIVIVEYVGGGNSE